MNTNIVKYIAIGTMLLVQPFVAGARAVDTLLARTLAQSIMSAKGMGAELHNVTPKDWNGTLILYTAEPKGYVLMSADDAVRPILAYSTEAPFPTENIPPQVQVLVNSYSDIVEYARQHNLPQHPAWKQRMSTTRPRLKDQTGVAPLVTTRWGQQYPYNILCPYDPRWDGVRSVTGCVATAMAQIMRYWQWPDIGWGQYGYDCYTSSSIYVGRLSERFDTVHYRWGLMPDTLGDHSTVAEIRAVSRLMYDCGAAVGMHYSYESSGANAWADWEYPVPSAGQALRTYFRYHPTLRYVENYCFGDSEWMTMMLAELDAGCPVLYVAGFHAFVLDGYDEERRLHFNFGWDGLYDGFYAVDSICMTDGYSFGKYHSAIIGIRPNPEENDSVTICAVPSDSLTGLCTGGGVFAYADSSVLRAYAEEGYRFDGWSCGSYDNPLYFPATATLTDTARIRPINADSLYYCTPYRKHKWNTDSTGAVTRWGIRIPATSLVGGRRICAVQYYKGFYLDDDTVRLKIYSGDPSDGEALIYEHTYISPEGPEGLRWITLPIESLVVIDTSNDLWITFEADAGRFDWSLYGRSTYGGNSDGCWFYNQTGWHTLDSVGIWATWMIRALARPASDPVSVDPVADVEENVVVYPNPTRGRVTVTSSEAVVVATVTDMAGRHDDVRVNAIGDGRYTFDISARPQGAYFLTITTTYGKQHTLRLIKQ
ncbi:MAG: thiol protease/hemagglutinin PrtT [Bacteroidales bacterium]|nr:thiol protease/hemagglutinin PrtT [Bacteroidales bacterium]